MKRNIDPDFEFDKVHFAEILKTAIGNRSIAEFARMAEISTGYLSRYVNQKVEVAPTLSTMKKLGKAAVGVSYLELLDAAGYDAEKYDDGTTEKITFLGPEWSTMNVLLPTFCRTNFKWQIINSDMNKSREGLISAKVEDTPFGMWYFIPVIKEIVTKEDINAVLGSEKAEVIRPGSKVTFLVVSKMMFEEISKMEFNLISLRISVALINPNDVIICAEHYLKTAVDLSEFDNKFVLTNIDHNEIKLLSI